MLFREDSVLCRILNVNYLNVSFSGFITYVGEDTAEFFLPLSARSYVLSVRRGLLLPLVLRVGCVIC